MPIVPCPECAKPMEQDDGFCGCCGAIIDSDLLDTGTDDVEPPTSPSLMAPDFSDGPAPLAADLGRAAVPGALDLGGFDERTDVAPPPLDDLPPPVELPPPIDPPPPPVAEVAPAPPPRPPAPKADEQPADAFQAFLEERTGAFSVDPAAVFEEETGTHRADRQAMVQPQVVLRRKAGVDAAALSPFEQHVLSFLDGKRPLARLRKKAGLTFPDLKVAIGMLADRGALEVVGSFKPDVRGMLAEEDLADTGPQPPAPVAPAAPPPPKPAPPAPRTLDTRPAAMPLPGQAAKPAAMPLPGQAAGPPRAATPPPRPSGQASRSAGPDPQARAQANQLLERALAEQRAGKRQAALALMHMAAELLPGDPRIEELRRALMAR